LACCSSQTELKELTMPVIDRSKPILVFLAAGVQGGAVVQEAITRGLKVRALVRNPTLSKRHPRDVEYVAGDLVDTGSLRTACQGIDHAVLQIPTGPGDIMRAQALNAITAFTLTGLRSFVLKLASASRELPCEEPGFVANQMVEDVARSFGMPYSVVRPTMYLDNLLKPSARAEIMEAGVFAPPVAEGQRIAWTSAEDCARATLILLEKGSVGGEHLIAGPESLTGGELAARVGAGLGRTVRYRAQPIEAFEHEVDIAMGKGSGRLIASKFRYFASHPQEADEILAGPFKMQSGLEGFTPLDVETWVRRHRNRFDI
jgi:uncharacterized protein YbjT (DUF2867 family)